MPWNKKTKTASDWKPVRVRREWLNVVREAGELQPKAQPYPRSHHLLRT